MATTILSLIGEALKLSENVRNLEIQEKMHAIRTRVLELEDALNKANRKLAAKEEMKPDGPLNYFYRDGKTDEPYCPVCWQRDEKAVRLPASLDFVTGHGRRCQICRVLFHEGPRKTAGSSGFRGGRGGTWS